MTKLPVLVTQRAAAPKNWVEFCQKSIGAFRCSLAMSTMTMKLTGTDRQAGRQTDRWTDGQTNLGIGRHAPPKTKGSYWFYKYEEYFV